jgi:hypothetical protein
MYSVSQVSVIRRKLGIPTPKNKKRSAFYATKEQKEFVKSQTNITIAELTKKFNEKYNTHLNQRQIGNMRRFVSKDKGIFRKWSEEELKFIKENYDKYLPKDLHRIMKEKFDEKINFNALTTTLYKKKLSYKKANNIKGYNDKPIGTVRIKGKEYQIKTEKGWESAGRYFYGEVPEDHIVIYLDGDNTNFSKENLKAVTLKEMGTLRAMCTNDKINYFGQKECTDAMLEIIKLEKLLRKRENKE